MSTAVPTLPEDLYGEITAYLWDDIPSLKACSLATRALTTAAQKLLFRSVALRPGRNVLRQEYVAAMAGDDALSGTSADFERLLARGPHIASHVRSMHIIDLSYQYERSGGDVLVNGVVELDEGEEIIRHFDPDTYTHATRAR